jgi:TRAP-type uncharacterized transport system substrate-binding protein
MQCSKTSALPLPPAGEADVAFYPKLPAGHAEISVIAHAWLGRAVACHPADNGAKRGPLMLWIKRQNLFIGLTTILCIVGIVSLVLIYFFPAPPAKITIASGVKGGAFDNFAQRYRERLARFHVTLDLHSTAGAADNLGPIEDRNSGVDAAFLFSGTTNNTQSPGLMSLGRISFNPIWVFYRGTETLDRLSQLKGKRIGMTTAHVAVQILAANGVKADNTTLLNRIGPAAAKALKDGEVDVILSLGELNTPYIQSLLRDPTIRLMNLTHAEGLARVFPGINRLVLPQGVVDFEKDIPPSDVSLIGVTTAVVVRKDLHPGMVYLLAQTLVEEHSGGGVFQRAGEFPTQTDPEFPMAERAVDFYKNGPPLLNRYLPFWVVPHVLRLLAVLLAGGAIIYPLFNFAPKLYQWFLQDRMRKLYRRLRIVEDAAQTELTAPQVVSLQTELENIDRAARILPQRHSDLFFTLEQHIILARTQLASRLVEARARQPKALGA